jgi:predicted outer membrane repeat protein
LAIPVPIRATIIHIPDDYPTIQLGIDASIDGDTVLVQPGIYMENINFNGHNIVVGSLFLTTGDTTYIAETTIDGNSVTEVAYFGHGETNEAELIGFTIKNGYGFWRAGGIYCNSSNPVIRNNLIIENIAAEYGAGVLCDNNSNPFIISNKIIQNSARFDGGGIECKDNSNAVIMNNVIIENEAAWGYGGGIFCQDSDPIIINNVVSGNSAGISGGGIYCELVSNPTVINTIFWADSAGYGNEIDMDDSSSPYLTYCDIQGGWGGEGNINFDPLFRNPDNNDYHLMTDECGQTDISQCIDAGSPDILDSLLDCS